ncbi:MAG: hypothetical protein JW971_03980 [Synergistales bacterium]|nr:hypothetical protein [Synergistales bacterium]
MKFFPRNIFSLSAYTLLTILLVLSPPAKTCHAYFRLLKVRRAPVTISVEQRKYEEGIIHRAFIRTPLEILPLKEIEGFQLTGENHRWQKLDGDKQPDLIWTISLSDPGSGDQYKLWVVTLTRGSRGWIFLTPYGENLWERLPFTVDVPEDVILHFSGSTPEYNGTPSLKGRDIMTFVYTLSFTEEGPKLVIAPEAYKILYRIASMVAAEETDPQVKFVYEMICSDFGKMSLGKMPSRDAVINFSWQQVINFPLEQ